MSGAASVRPVRALLFGLDRKQILGAVRLAVIGDEVPDIVMLDGEPFIKMPTPPQWEARAVIAYAQTVPYRADARLMELRP